MEPGVTVWGRAVGAHRGTSPTGTAQVGIATPSSTICRWKVLECGLESPSADVPLANRVARMFCS